MSLRHNQPLDIAELLFFSLLSIELIYNWMLLRGSDPSYERIFNIKYYFKIRSMLTILILFKGQHFNYLVKIYLTMCFTLEKRCVCS